MAARYILFFFVLVPTFCLGQFPLIDGYNFYQQGIYYFEEGEFKLKPKVKTPIIRSVIKSIEYSEKNSFSSSWDVHHSYKFETDSCMNWVIRYNNQNLFTPITNDTTCHFLYETLGQNIIIVQKPDINRGWIDVQKISQRFDVDNQLMSQVNFYWTDNEWLEQDSTNIAYYVNGNEETEEVLRYSGSFIHGYRGIYTKDLTNPELIIQYEEQLYEGGNWVTSFSVSNQYDSNGLLIESVVVNGTNSPFDLDRKNEYTYNSSNQKESKISFAWSNDEWLTRSKNEYFYNNMGLLDSTILYSLLDSIPNLFFGYSSSIQYNSEGQITLKSYYSYSDGIWIFSSKQENNYEEICCKYKDPECSSPLNSITSKFSFSVFPTVSSGSFNIKWYEEAHLVEKSKNLRVWDSTGRMVHQEIVKSRKAEIILQLEKLSRGIYYVQIITDDQSYTSPIIIQK